MPELVTSIDGPWWKTRMPDGTPILDPERHYRLIQQRQGIARRAGLGEAFMSAIWDPLPPEVTRNQRQWLINIIYKQPQHLLFHGRISMVSHCFRALTGALLRNEIDARLMTVEEIVQLAMEGEQVDAGVLLVSDFAVKDEPRSEPVKRKLIGVLRQRINAGLPMALYITDAEAFSKTYGPSAFEEFNFHFGNERLTA